MKYIIFFILLLHFLACNNSEKPRMLPRFGKPVDEVTKEFHLSREKAHPNAQRLMNEDFYWSTDSATGPFGSADAWQAADFFRVWRARNKTVSPVAYLRELLDAWGVPYFDWKELDTIKIKAHMDTMTGDSAARSILWQDDAIIGTAFSQFMLEGKTDTELRQLAATAIKRQLLPVLINRYEQPYREQRIEQLNKMLNVVMQMNAL